MRGSGGVRRLCRRRLGFHPENPVPGVAYSDRSDRVPSFLLSSDVSDGGGRSDHLTPSPCRLRSAVPWSVPLPFSPPATELETVSDCPIGGTAGSSV